MNGENRRALLENLWGSIDGAFALWIQYERESMPQTEGSGAHSRNQVRIGIDHHYFDRPRQSPHEAFAEDVAGAYGEQVVEDFGWHQTGQDDRIEIAFVIRR